MRRFLAMLTCLMICACVFGAAGAENETGLLCNADASAETKELMQWMQEVYGKKIISGQFLDEGRYGQELIAIGQETGGLFPAMVGLDMMNYSGSSIDLGAHPVTVDQAIDYWKQGHIITMCWHWRPPEEYMDTTGTKWWGGFYTENTTFNLGKAMNGEDPEGYELMIEDLDRIAVQLQRLRDAGVPVLWRPLHEASGRWFWWGASGPEPYIQLYRLMYDRFTKEYGLNNLIWVWNGQNAAWYPGDDVVDIIGEDVYPGKHVHDSRKSEFDRCGTYGNGSKMIILSECGCVPSPEACQEDQAMWGSWCVWCYEFVLDDQGNYSGEYTTAEQLKEAYNSPLVLTLRDVPAFGRKTETGSAEAENSAVYHFADGEVTGNVTKAGKTVQVRGNEKTDTVTIQIEVPEDGQYILRIVQAGIGGHKENDILLDGEWIGNSIVQGEAEEACDLEPVFMTKGKHELTLQAVWGWVTLKTAELIRVP